MTLDEIALKHKTDKASPWHDYARVYERYFAGRRNDPLNILEIGVQFGLSLFTWSEYFPNAKIYGVDIITASCLPQPPNVTVICGDATLVDTYRDVPDKLDIVVDDGSHRVADQHIAFNLLWKRVNPGGIYAIEDVGTWWDEYFNHPGSHFSFSSMLLSAVHHGGKDYHGKPGGHQPLSDLERELKEIHMTRDLIILIKA